MVSSGTSPTTSAVAPHQSMRDGRGWCSMLSVWLTTNNATMPIGTFTRNTQRQPVIDRIESAPAKKPPTTGPSTLEVPKTARK